MMPKRVAKVLYFSLSELVVYSRTSSSKEIVPLIMKRRDVAGMVMAAKGQLLFVCAWLHRNLVGCFI